MDAGVATAPARSIPGMRKAAILLVSLGPEVAAEIFRHLSDDQIEKLTIEMARLGDVDGDEHDAVQYELLESAYQKGWVSSGGAAYAREVLELALGEERASEILGRLSAMIEQSPFEFLRSTPGDQIYAFLRGEHPQTIALVLANLPRTDLAAEVMQHMPEAEQAEVAMRIAAMSQTSPEVVKDVAQVMRSRVQLVVQQDFAAAGGVQTLAEILNSADRATERNILDRLQEEDQALADEIRSLLFTFEDIVQLDDRSMQLVLKQVDVKELSLALRGASSEVKERVFRNMSERGAQMLREEMEFQPPQRKRVVEEAQVRIVGVVRKLEEAGAIVLSRGGGDDDAI